MRFELKRLQRELGITTVYVTHDQSEALALSHSIAVMDRGVIQQIGAPREIYERPGNQFVADFIGSTNFLHATVKSGDGSGIYHVSSEVGDLRVRGETLAPGAKVVVSVRPEDIRLSETRPQGDNVLQATVHTKVFLGESVDFEVKIGERALLSRAHPSLGTRVGHPIYLSLDAEKCIALKDE
jgi:iron(III) transport system ATP-binding protein